MSKATGGTFTVTSGGKTSAPLPHDATPAQIAAAIPKGRPLIPKGGDDRVYTPDALAAAIVAHFEPSGRTLDPCRGKRAFSRCMPDCDFCELDEGLDFLKIKVSKRYDWIVTNPPWGKFRPFLIHAMRSAENVVYLVTVNHFFTKARVRDMDEACFGLVEILYVDTPPKPWPQSGFQVAAVHIRRGYAGPVKIGRL